jgi:TPR repeat protein
MTTPSKWVSRFALLLVVLVTTLALSSAQAATRRAFVVGVQKYSDPGLQPLLRPANDAADLAKDLEDVGFAHENIKVATTFRTKAEFVKSLGDFLNAVKPGDEVLFFFSGHGFASSDKKDVNYLLFGGTRSLLTFTRDRLAKSTEKQDRDQSKDAAAVRLRQKDFEINYEVEEIKSVGVSVEDVQNQIMAKSPARLLMFLDACRTLALAGSELPGAAPMTGLHTRTPDWLKDGVAILYSASDGQAAIENMNFFDQRRDSLFTDVLRLNLARPGVELRKLAEQVSAQVDAVAFTRTGLHQKPEFVEKQAGDFSFVPSIGAERFPLPPEAQPCFGSQKDFEDAKSAQDAPEDRLITHIEIFAQCPSADDARAELSRLRAFSGHFTHPPGDCDDLAASPFDASLRGRPGVPFERIGRLDPPRDHIQQVGEPDEFDTKYVVDVCAEAVKANPRVSRYALNLARAEHAHALNPRVDAQTRREYLERAKFDYERLAEAGEALAMNNLAQFYEYGGDSSLKDSERRWIDPQKALELWGKAAQQGLPVAQYNLALKYRFGWTEAGLKMDIGEFRHWMGLAARAGSVSAIDWEADSEKLGVGNDGNEKNPALAAELFKRAARMGAGKASIDAERFLGFLELNGASGGAQSTLANAKAGDSAPTASVDAKGVAPDPQEALIWFGRAAAHGDAMSNYVLARLLEMGRGVSEPQPTIAARYLRAAAEAGSASAQVEYVDKIVDGELMLRFDDRDQVIDRLLKRAMAPKVERGPSTESGAAERTRELGNGRAALLLAERAWPTEAGQPRNAKLAAAYAFAAIDLAAHANPAEHYFQNDFSPLTEIAAGQFLVMLAHEPDCVDEFGKPLFSKAEIDTMEKYYGLYDAKQRRVVVKIIDMYDYENAMPQADAVRLPLWVWDWGRAEAPTEQQFRRIELWRDTTFYDLYRDRYFARKRNDPTAMHAHPEYVTQNMLRSSLSDIYSISRNIKTSFLDLLANKLDLISKKQ